MGSSVARATMLLPCAKPVRLAFAPKALHHHPTLRLPFAERGAAQRITVAERQAIVRQYFADAPRPMSDGRLLWTSPDQLKEIEVNSGGRSAIESDAGSRVEDSAGPAPDAHYGGTTTPFVPLRPCARCNGVRSWAKGMDARLWALLSSPEIRRHKVYAPGIEPLERSAAIAYLAESRRSQTHRLAPAAGLSLYRAQWGKVAGPRRQTTGRSFGSRSRRLLTGPPCWSQSQGPTEVGAQKV